jgi:hypothetical protein
MKNEAELAAIRIMQAFSESTPQKILITDEGRVLIELNSGRNFELSKGEVKHQAEMYLKELEDGAKD